MTQTLRYSLLTGVILVLTPCVDAGDRAATELPPLEIQVRVYNYARVPGHILERAQEEVAHILGEAGVRASFAPCALAAEELDLFPQCSAERRKTDLVVAVVSEQMAKKMGKGHDVFGIAASSEDGFAYRTNIFYHRVKEYAGRWQASPALLLGHFIAHEIGHLLLGADSHSRQGIMHVPWKKAERELIHRAGLLFTDAEAERIRADVIRRLQAETPELLAAEGR